MLASMALVGQQLAPSSDWATLPLALAPVATMLMTVPVAQLMQRRGRRLGFALGAGLGVCGGLMGCLAVYRADFVLLCLGGSGIGAVNGFATYYRFAAGEVVKKDFRSRAISLVMAGGVIAAVTGSNLAIWSREWFSDDLFAGSFLAIAILHCVVLSVLYFVVFPAPSVEERQVGGRSLREIAHQADFALAVIGAVAAWGVMSLLMNATPLAMKRHLHSFADTAWVIQWHVLGMFVPSFFTGHLVSRWGEHRIMFAGICLLGGAITVNLSGIELYHYAIGLGLLGVGWNFLFVGATSLLATTHRPEEKARVQSCNDVLVYGLMVVTSFSAAPLEGMLGWDRLNHFAAPFLVVVAAVMAVLWARTERRA